MKKTHKLLLSFIFALTIVALFAATPVSAASKKNGLKKVTITKVSKWVDPTVEGVFYKLKWSKVRGAKGYQVKETRSDMNEWYTHSSFNKKRSYQTGAEIKETLKIKVRAYKIVNGKKKYGPWSKTKIIKVER